jgi:prepilin-type N-terminal cleavage/methylation domain-containing protein
METKVAVWPTKKKQRSLTLLEVVVVVVIIGILVTFAMPAYVVARRGAIDREAQSQLKLIQSAEIMVRLETGNYITCTDNLNCNAGLNLDLPPTRANTGNWDYVITSANIATTFLARASGTRGTSNWQIDEDDDEASIP